MSFAAMSLSLFTLRFVYLSFNLHGYDFIIDVNDVLIRLFVWLICWRRKMKDVSFWKYQEVFCTTWCSSTWFFVKQNKVRFALQRLKGRFQQLACFGTAFFVRCKWTHYSLDGEEIGGGGEISVCAYLFGWLLFLCGAYWICNVARLEMIMMISIEILSKNDKIRWSLQINIDVSN